MCVVRFAYHVYFQYHGWQHEQQHAVLLLTHFTQIENHTNLVRMHAKKRHSVATPHAKFSCLHPMEGTFKTETDSATTAAGAAGAGKAPRKALSSRRSKSSGNKRPAARPHRRLDEGVLKFRITDMQKKSTVLKSKLVLLESRLETHLNEEMLRTEAMPAAV